MRAIDGILTILFTAGGLLGPTCWAQVQINPRGQQSPANVQASVRNEANTDLNEIRKMSISFKTLGETSRFRILSDDDNRKPEALKKQLIRPSRLLETNSRENALGPGSTGGGFANYRGSYRTLVELVQKNLTKLRNMSDEYFEYFIPEPHKKIITREKFAMHLRNIEYSYFQQGYSVAPNGQIDTLMADFATDSGEIILLKDFFQTYNQEIPSPESKLAMIRIVFHEITHLFGLGLSNDDESYELSLVLLFAVYDFDYMCGSTGALENDIESCSEKTFVDKGTVYHSKRELLEFPEGSKNFLRPIAIMKINQLAAYLASEENKSFSEFVVAFNRLLQQRRMNIFKFPDDSPIPHRFDFFTVVGLYEGSGKFVAKYTMDLGIFPKNSNPRRVLEEFCSNFTMINKTYRGLKWKLSSEDRSTQRCLNEPGPRNCDKFMHFTCVADAGE